MTPQAEFNFHADPEAAFIVLNDLQLPITLVTWETCLKYSFCWVGSVVNSLQCFSCNKQKCRIINNNFIIICNVF